MSRMKKKRLKRGSQGFSICSHNPRYLVEEGKKRKRTGVASPVYIATKLRVYCAALTNDSISA